MVKVLTPCFFLRSCHRILTPEGGLGKFVDRDQQSIFRTFNFEYRYFWGIGRICCIFGLPNECFLCPVFVPGYISNTVLLYDHIVLTLC